jgi:small subunit ribosomal protein S6
MAANRRRVQRREKRSMERFYEVMFIVRPDVEDADLDKLIAGFENTVTSGGGNVRSAEKLGRRKLAYTVRKFNDGNYILLTIDADGKLVAELERRLRVSEPVIKFITVRMDEEQKRLDKVKAIRATRKKVSAQPAAEAPAAETVSAPAPAAEAAAAPAAEAAGA